MRMQCKSALHFFVYLRLGVEQKISPAVRMSPGIFDGVLLLFWWSFFVCFYNRGRNSVITDVAVVMALRKMPGSAGRNFSHRNNHSILPPHPR